jgi:hypothetical protein
MRKLNILLIAALLTAVLASITLVQVRTVSAQEVPPTGVVVEYLPGQSITVVDQNGTQHQYTISSTVKILPPVRSNALKVGSFVTIIAPASLSQGKQMAVGIVVHPHVPNGWNVTALTATPLVTSTAVETFTATAPGTAMATETGMPTATETATATGTQLATDTETATSTPTIMGTATDTAAPTATPIGGGTAASTNALIEWLRSLFQQILIRR